MYLLFDIGGTKTRLAISDNFSKLKKVIIFETPNSYDDFLKKLTFEANNLLNGFAVKKVAGGVPGFVSPRGELHIWNQLSSWNGRSLKKDLEKIFKCEAIIQNDAALGALGESRYGAGKNKNIVAYITISTGVNGAKVVNKKIDENSIGFEIGHQVINFDSDKKTFGELVSGENLSKKHGQLRKINDKKFWQKESELVAIGVINSILFWSPDIVILGGGISQRLNLDLIKKEVKKNLYFYKKLPEIKLSKLKDLNGIYGALSLVKN